MRNVQYLLFSVYVWVVLVEGYVVWMWPSVLNLLKGNDNHDLKGHLIWHLNVFISEGLLSNHISSHLLEVPQRFQCCALCQNGVLGLICPSIHCLIFKAFQNVVNSSMGKRWRAGNPPIALLQSAKLDHFIHGGYKGTAPGLKTVML
jgi:hypothetical protein